MSMFDPVERPRSLAELAYERLRGALLAGDLAPGQVLSVVKLAEALQMSRSPVRSAVERVIGDGLLRLQGSSVVVRSLEVDELVATLQVRAPLEGLAAELATPHLEGSSLEKVRQAHRWLRRAVSARDAQAARRNDLAFHEEVLARCGNPVLVEQLGRLQTLVTVAGGATPDETDVEELGALLEAIERKDAVGAARLAYEHQMNLRQRTSRA